MATSSSSLGFVSPSASASSSSSASPSPLSADSDGPTIVSAPLSPNDRALFTRHPVSELRRLGEDRRNASDEKKEELRQLVGIRYRVLIQTADSITKMKQIGEESKKKYDQIQQLIPQMSLSREDESVQSPSEIQLLAMLRSYALAPATIWNYLDLHDFDSAIALYLAMQDIGERLECIDVWPTDSEANHPALKAIVEAALQAPALTQSPSSTSQTLPRALAAFYHLHAGYYMELPSLISWVASNRLQQRGFDTRSYSSALSAIAICADTSEPIGEYLLSQFLSSKHKQIHDLLWSAECALKTFLDSSANSDTAPSAFANSKNRRNNPTPIIEHACQQILITLQHTLLDSAMLFSSIKSETNPHASQVNMSTSLMEDWQQSNIVERVASIQARVTGQPASSMTLSPLVLSTSQLSSRLQSWLSDISRLVSDRLIHHLLPYLARSTRPCTKFAHLRASVLRVADWADPQCHIARESDQPVTNAAEANKSFVTAGKYEDEKENTSANVVATHKSIDPRKRMKQRWTDACVLLFGLNASGSTVSSSIDLFDLLYFEPFRSHTTQLLVRAFDRFTLISKVDEYLHENATRIATDKKVTPPPQRKLIVDSLGEDDDERKDEKKKENEEDSSTISTASALVSSSNTLELHGLREEDVQEIVHSFHRQLHQLGRECGAVLQCEYTPLVPGTSSTTNSANTSVSTLFPRLYKYLQEDLAPLLTNKYNQLVEKLVEQLKKKLTDLEHSVLSSMSDLSSWRSVATLRLVDQSVFIGRICHELTKQKHLMSLETILHQASHHAKTPNNRANTAAGPYNPIHSSLAATAKSAFRIWSRYLSARLSEDFVDEFELQLKNWKQLHEKGGNGELNYWKQIGSNRNHSDSTPLGLYLPVHPSSYITRLLFTLHGHYYRSFGYHVYPEILTWLLQDVVQSLIAICEKKVYKRVDTPSGAEDGDDILAHLVPNAVVQTMFDMQYLFAVLRLPPSTNTPAALANGIAALKVTLPNANTTDPRARYTKLMATFESHLSVSLDQIEWLASKSSFHTNLLASVGRASMLYGILCKTNPFPPSFPPNSSLATPAPFRGSGGDHTPAYTSHAPIATNILPLATATPKILPLPTSLYPSKHPQPVPVVIKPTLTPSTITSTAPSTSFSASSSSISLSSSTPSTTTASAPKSEGLSFSNLSSNLSSQLALANSQAAVNAKAIGDLGSTLLGKLSANSLWGKK